MSRVPPPSNKNVKGSEKEKNVNLYILYDRLENESSHLDFVNFFNAKIQLKQTVYLRNHKKTN